MNVKKEYIFCVYYRFAILYVFGMACQGIGFILMFETMKIPYWLLVVFECTVFVQGCALSAPIYLFFLVFGDVTIYLILWCIQIIETTNNPIEKLSKSKQFLKALRAVDDLFSDYIFWQLVSSLIGLILSSYRAVSFIFGKYEFNSVTCTFAIYFVFIWVAYISFYLYFCHFSQLLASKIQEMKIDIMDLNLDSNFWISKSMSELKFLHEKESIARHLDDFKGYNAKDYFTVNHSLITAMTSNFLTYFIILVQFKFTELSLISSTTELKNATTTNYENLPVVDDTINVTIIDDDSLF